MASPSQPVLARPALMRRTDIRQSERKPGASRAFAGVSTRPGDHPHQHASSFAAIGSNRYRNPINRVFVFRSLQESALPTHPPLFVIGAPRSGNTLVRRVLMASGQIYIPPETYVFGEIIARWPRWFALSWREKVWMVCAYFDRHPHRDDMEIGSLSPFAELACALPRSQQNLRSLYDCLYAFMAREHGFTEQRWGDKTPWNTYYLHHIVKKYPDAQYLYLVRDGRDVIASQVKAGFGSLLEAANRWVEANSSCLNTLNNKRLSTMTVRYEALVTAPVTSFEAIYNWAGLSFQQRFLEEVPARLADVGRLDHHAQVMRPITDSSIGRWKETMSESDVTSLPPAFLSMLTRNGYRV